MLLWCLRMLVGAVLVVGLQGCDTDAIRGYASDLSGHRRAGALKYPEIPETLAKRIKAGVSYKASTPGIVDPLLDEQWGLKTIEYFDAKEVCSRAVVVAVIDTGIDYTHDDLSNNLWINRGETGPWEPPPGTTGPLANCHDKSCNGIDDDGNGFVDDVIGWDFVHEVPLPYDTHGHGTHISGIIAAQANDGFGISGICPVARIMSLKYYDNSGGASGYNNLINTVRAIHYAIKNGAQIINYSGGGSDASRSERQAIEEADRAGILFVAAAGNNSQLLEKHPYYPASYGALNIISVAAINKLSQLLPSSNFGLSVDLAAPGLMIMSDLPGNHFGTMSGTSQATAFATGTAALLLSQLHKRDPHLLKAAMLRGTKPIFDTYGKVLLKSGAVSVPEALKALKDLTGSTK